MAGELQVQLEEATQKLAIAAKSGDERVIALEKASTELENSMKEQIKISEKQAWDLEEAQTALRALHSAVCKQGPAPVLGGIGIALGTETINVKGKQRKMVKITQVASSGPAAKAGVQIGVSMITYYDYLLDFIHSSHTILYCGVTSFISTRHTF